MSSRAHLTPEEVERLRGGRADATDYRRAVRHLIAGCPECALALGPLLGFTVRFTLGRNHGTCLKKGSRTSEDLAAPTPQEAHSGHRRIAPGAACRPLPVTRVRHEELIRRALSEPLNCWLVVLIAHPGRGGTDYRLPCLQFTEQRKLIESDLVLHRSSYLAVEDSRLARALFDHLPKGKGARAKGLLYSPEGILRAGEPFL